MAINIPDNRTYVSLTNISPNQIHVDAGLQYLAIRLQI